MTARLPKPLPQPSRRRFLRSTVASIALPLLPSLTRPSSGGAQPANPPKRFIAIYTPGGVIQTGLARVRHGNDNWTAGSNFSRLGDSNHILHSVRDLSADLIQVQKTQRETLYEGLSRGLPSGIGHWDELTSFLTGSGLKKAGDKASLHELELNGPSIDHKIASVTGHRPLAIGVMPDVNYPALHAMSWRNARQADVRLNSPLQVYAEIFGGPEAQTDSARFKNLLKLRRSILDGVSSEQKRFQSQLSRADRHHLDAFFTNVREAEQRLAEHRELSCATPSATRYSNPDRTAVADLLVDLGLIALECDATRVVTFAVWGVAGGTGGPIMGSYVPGLKQPRRDYHIYSHFHDAKGNDLGVADFRKICQWSARNFERFVRGLKSRTDSDGHTMLRNSLIMYGSGIGDGASHEYRNVARMFAGQAGGAVRTGRVIEARGRSGGQQQPVEDLLPEILDLFDYRKPDGSPQKKVGLSKDILSLR